MKVFTGVLLDSLDKLREEDDVGLLDRLPDLVVSFCSEPDNVAIIEIGH